MLFANHASASLLNPILSAQHCLPSVIQVQGKAVGRVWSSRLLFLDTPAQQLSCQSMSEEFKHL